MTATLDDLVEKWAPLDRLTPYLRERGIAQHVEVVGKATGGSSNITLFVELDGEKHVLRRPPMGELLATAHDVHREWTYMSALSGTGVPVAHPIALCEDASVIGSPFYLMSFVDGRHLGDPAIAPDLIDHPERTRALSESMVDVLAHMHQLDWRELSLPAKSGKFVERQLNRWNRQLANTATASRLGSAPAEIAAWLAERIPQHTVDTIVHGDYSANNMMFSRADDGDPRVVAVVDWEMATIGDPLADLTWMLLRWGEGAPTDGDGNAGWVLGQPGVLSKADAIARYEAATGFQYQEHEAFYVALQRYKSFAILEGLYAGYVAGNATNPANAKFETVVPQAVAELHDYIRTN